MSPIMLEIRDEKIGLWVVWSAWPGGLENPYHCGNGLACIYVSLCIPGSENLHIV